MATENVTFFSDNFPTATKHKNSSKKETVSWFSDNIETVINIHKNNYRTFLETVSAADGWQSQESMEEYIGKVREAQGDDIYGIGSEAYDKLIQSLESNKAIYAGYESAEDFNANHEKNVAYRQQLLDNDPDALRGEIAALEQRLSTALNTDGSRDTYEALLAEEVERLVDEYTRNNFDGLSEEQIHTLAVKQAKSNPRLQVLGAESGASSREDPNAVKKLLDQKVVELNTTLMLQQEYRLTEEALAAPDFAEKSAYKPSLAGGNDRWSLLYREINTPSDGAGTNNVGYMSEAERALFNYHFSAGGAAKAEEYLNSIQNALNARKAGEIYENHFENRVLRELAYGLYAGVDSAVTGIKNAVGKKKDFYATNTAQHLSGMVAEDVSKNGLLASSAYSLATTTGQMAPAIITSAVVSHVPVVGAALAPIAGAAVTGTSTYGNAYAEMINSGYNAKQANTYALLVGASEAGLEMVLGGYDGLRATKPSGALIKLANKLDNGFFRAALVLADSGLDEFKEEALQELLDPVFKTIATGVDDERLNNVDWGQVLYAGMIGALTAGLLNGAPRVANAATNGIRTAVQGARLQKNGVNVQGLKAMGEAMPADTVAHKLAGKVAEDSGAYTIAKLFNAVGAELTQQNQADIVYNLTHKGVQTKDAETIAAYLAAAVNGAEFTSRQVKAIENNPLIAEAMRETLIDPTSSVNRRMQNFKQTVFAQPSNVSLETDGETGYTDNGTQYSINKDSVDYVALDRYDSRTYANHGWVTVNRVLSGTALKRLYSQFSQFHNNQHKFPTTPQGEAMIVVGDTAESADTIVYISGTNQNPIISKVVKITPNDPNDVSEIRQFIIESEVQGDVDTRAVLEGFTGETVLIEQSSADYASYRELQSQRAGNPIGNGDHQQQPFGGRSGAADLAGDRNTVNNSISDDVSLPSSDGTGRDSYTQNAGNALSEAERQRRIQEIENGDFSGIRRFAGEQQNPQQTAVGVDSRAQNTGTARDTGVEIGVRPSAMDVTFKGMTAAERKKLYAALKEHTGVTIAEDRTLPYDGEYDPKTKTIRINPDRATPITVLKHELTHYIESSKILYQDFMNYAMEQSTAFNDWLASKGQTLPEMKAEIVKRYAASGVALSTERGASAEQEILANFTAEVLFNDINALRELGATRPTLFNRLRHFIQGIINKIKGITENDELRYLEQLFAAAAEKAQDVGKGEIKYSIGLSFAEQIQQILDGTFDKEHSHLFVRANTPEIYTNLKRVSIPNLPIVMSYDNAVVSLFDAGAETKSDHNHGIGQKMMSILPQMIEDPLYIVVLPNGRINAILENVDSKGRHYFISLELEVQKPVSEVYSGGYRGKQHLLLTVFGARENYIKKILSSPENVVVYDKKKDSNPRGNPEGNGLNIINGSKSLDTSIAQPPTGVNTYSTQGGTKKFIAPEAVAEMPGDQLTDEELMAQFRKRGMTSTPNPLKIAQMRPDDANTTPRLRRNGPMNERGDGESAFAGSIQNSSLFSDELKQLAAEDENITRYDMVTNKETLAAANELINTGGRAFVEQFMQKDSDAYTAEDNAVAVILMRRYGAIGDNQSAVALAEKLRKAATKQGQAVQILSILRRLTPEGMVMYAQKELQQAYEELVKGQSNKWIDENKAKFDLNDEDIEFIRRRTWQAAQLPPGRDKDIRLAEIAARIQSKIPQKKGQAYKAFQRTAMLLNPKTQLRNVLGNLTMVGAFYASDAVGSVVDKIAAKATGVRTTFAGLSKEAVAGFKRGFFESYDDFLRHINTRDIRANRFEIDAHSLDNFNENHTGLAANARNKLSRALNALDRFNSFLLDAGDRPFYEMWFVHSINGQMAAANVTEPTADMIEIATLDALERTWQDPNGLTKWLSNIKNGMNHIQFQGYGLGDVVLKFVKTPANLTKAMVEFSPIGLTKALAIDAVKFYSAVKDGRVTPQMQRRFVKNLSNGIVGTMLTIIAASLAQAGLLTGEQDEDKDVAAFEKAVLGYQPYSVKIGNASFSYDWMQPIGAHLAAAADAYQEFENSELTGEKLSLFQQILSALKAGGRVLFNQSFMQSIHTFMSDDDAVTNIINSLLADVNAPVSQFFSQTAAVLDPTVRTTYEYGNDVQTAINKVLYKLPGARQTLAPSVDVLGNERTGLENGTARAFSAYVSPFNIGKGYSSVAGEEMYRLYEATGEAAAIAPLAPNYVNSTQGKHSLSSHQKAEYQTITGQTASAAVEALLQNAAYEKLSDDDKLEVLTSIYAYAKQTANKQVLGLELNESAAKAQAAIGNGVPVELYFLLKKTADNDGNSSVSQKEARAILDATTMSREQKAIMWKSFNSGWKNNPYGTYKYY